MPHYHARINGRVRTLAFYETALDLTREQALLLIIRPWLTDRPIIVNGKRIAYQDIRRLRVNVTDEVSGHYRRAAEERYSEASSRSIEWYVADAGRDVTNELIEAGVSNHREPRPSTDAREVFVVHGRNISARNAMFEFLNAIGLHPLEWSEAVQSTGQASPYIGDILEAAFSRAHAVIVLMSPDDEARLREAFREPNDGADEIELTGQARPNVLFEAGIAMGRSAERTVLVELGHLRKFSDVAGRHTIRFDGGSESRQALAQRLQTAGCPVNMNGTRWHSAGDFKEALQLANATDLRFSEDVMSLLNAAVTGDGTLTTYGINGGLVIQAGAHGFGGPGDLREETRWRDALNSASGLGLIAGGPSQFAVTHTGREAVENHKRPAS